LSDRWANHQQRAGLHPAAGRGPVACAGRDRTNRAVIGKDQVVTDPTSATTQPPTTAEIIQDRGFRGLTILFAWLTLAVLALLLWQIVAAGAPAMESYGFGFLTSSTWDAGKANFGILPQIGGTLYSSFLGVFIGTVFGVAVAILLTQDFLPHWLEI